MLSKQVHLNRICARNCALTSCCCCLDCLGQCFSTFTAFSPFKIGFKFFGLVTQIRHRRVIFLIDFQFAKANMVQLLNLSLAITKNFGPVDNFFGPANGTGPGG